MPFHELKQYKVKQNVVFQFNNNTDLLALLQSELKKFNSNDLMFFDDSVIGTLQQNSIEFISYTDKKIQLDISALSKLSSSYVNANLNPTKSNKSAANNNPTGLFKQKNIMGVVKKLNESKISSDRLEKVFQERAITNDVFQQSLVKHMESLNIDVNKLSQDEFDKIVFIKLYETIHGPTKSIPPDILNNPDKLFDQLELFTEHREPLNFNKSKNAFISPSKKYISIDYVTGPSRHKYEFSENIHEHVNKLFKTLEDKTAPIEIQGIQHEIKDNNVDRYIEYTILLQNKTGGTKLPYEIKLRVPYLVNDRYFKLNGKEYILSSQQFLNPLTKNNPDEARFLSHYNIITEKLVNFKYSPSSLDNIIDYIARTYSKSIKKYDSINKSIIFKDDTSIDLSNVELPFKTKNKELKFEGGQYFLYLNGVKSTTPIRKTEFIYEQLIKIINNINPEDHLKKSIRSVQYVEIHVMGPKMPLILALWQQLGLTESLAKLGIDFEILDNSEDIKVNKSQLSFNLLDDKILIISPESKREEYIVNGLLKLPFIENLTSEDITKRDTCFNYLTDTYGSKILNNLDGMVENAIDPTTKELLEYHGLPTNIIDIISGPQLDKLFNDPVDHPSDLSSLRVRLSEYMTQLLYNEINQLSLYYGNIVNQIS